MNKQPKEIISMILDYCDSFKTYRQWCLVCKRWRDLLKTAGIRNVLQTVLIDQVFSMLDHRYASLMKTAQPQVLTRLRCMMRQQHLLEFIYFPRAKAGDPVPLGPLQGNLEGAAGVFLTYWGKRQSGDLVDYNAATYTAVSFEAATLLLPHVHMQSIPTDYGTGFIPVFNNVFNNGWKLKFPEPIPIMFAIPIKK